jgi:hypothetical protein
MKLIQRYGAARIELAVTDGTGAVLPGVEVKLTRTDTGAVRDAVTNETGAYAFPSLNPGPFRLEISLPGFRPFVQSGIVLQVGGNLVIDRVLEVGAVTLAGGNPFPFDWRVTPLFLPASVLLPFDPDLNTPYSHNWSVSLQHEFAGQWRVSSSYMGNMGKRMWGMEALNPVVHLTQQSHPHLFTGPNSCVLLARRQSRQPVRISSERAVSFCEADL